MTRRERRVACCGVFFSFSVTSYWSEIERAGLGATGYSRADIDDVRRRMFAIVIKLHFQARLPGDDNLGSMARTMTAQRFGKLRGHAIGAFAFEPDCGAGDESHFEKSLVDPPDEAD